MAKSLANASSLCVLAQLICWPMNACPCYLHVYKWRISVNLQLARAKIVSTDTPSQRAQLKVSGEPTLHSMGKEMIKPVLNQILILLNL